jgi:DNA polymerase elongation subunit (family B)
MLSYVYPDYRKSKIIYWEYENGVKKQLEADMPLYFYIDDEEGEYKTINGKRAKKIEFDTWSKFKEKRDKYRDFNFKMYESDISLQTKFICNHYYRKELTIPKEFNVFFVDIETYLETGFPRPEEALGKITVITVYSTKEKKFYIFAEKDFDGDFIKTKHGFDYQKRIHSTEEDLLRDFISFVYINHPDVLSGWNSQDYDIPYIVNRARKILDPDEIEKMSPVHQIREEEVRDKKSGVIRKQYFIQGINCIDLMEVYKNYSGSIKSSYALDSICREEINEGKNVYKGTLNELYKDWQKYVEYNIQDVDLLRKLDEKLGYMSLLITFCYGCKVPFEHYSKTTRVLDGAFISKLIEEQIVLPDVDRKLIDEMNKLKERIQAMDEDSDEISEEELNTINNKKYVGGYVATPEKGLHEWIESFDAESLYPSIMIGWNISPETKLGTIENDSLVEYVYRFMEGDTSVGHIKLPVRVGIKTTTTSVEKLAQCIKKNNYCLAGNGTFYSQDFVGVIPKFVSEWFTKRKKFKSMMLDFKKKGNKEQEHYYNLLQWNFKILINSVYGYLGSKYSRFYDIDNARAVTLTGQAGLKRTINRLNTFFENEWSTKNTNAKNFKNFVIYGDTDSVYVSASRYLNSFNYIPDKTISQTVVDELKDIFKVDTVEIKGDSILFGIKKGDKVSTISHDITNENTIIHLNKNLKILFKIY